MLWLFIEHSSIGFYSPTQIYIYIYIYIYITLLHFGVVEHSAELIGCPLAIMQSSLPPWLFEHSGPMSLCACLDALMVRVVPHALGRASVMYINTKVIACLDVYQAALMRRRTPKHACLQIVLYIYIYIYIYI